jgi:hypothetical protein
MLSSSKNWMMSVICFKLSFVKILNLTEAEKIKAH